MPPALGVWLRGVSAGLWLLRVLFWLEKSALVSFSPRLQPALVKGLSLWRKKVGVVKIRINHKLFIDRGITPETASVFQPSPIATTAACPMNSS